MSYKFPRNLEVVPTEITLGYRKVLRLGHYSFSAWCPLKGHTCLNKPAALSFRRGLYLHAMPFLDFFWYFFTPETLNLHKFYVVLIFELP